MAQEDETHKGIGSSSSSAFSSKKPKEKKVPQRGLGVAQLEKIRLEEQQKKAVASSLMLSPSPPSLSIPNHRNFDADRSPPSSVPPFPSVSSHNIGMTRPSYDHHHHQLANNLAHHNSYEIPGNSKVPKVWNFCDYYVDKGGNFNPGLALNMNLPHEPNPIRPLIGLVQGTQQFDQVSPSMVNVQTPALLPPALSIQMEPPSNQSYYGNNNALIWAEEEQMAGKKRLHAFLDHPPGPSFNLKSPSFPAQPRADGSASRGNGSTFNLKLREDPSYSASIQEPNSENGIKENSAWNANFLALSLPATTTATSLSPNFNLPFSSMAFHSYEISDFKTIPYQEIMDELIFQPGLSRSNEQLHFHSFFPPAKKQNCEATSTPVNDSTGGTDENVDLNLKL